MSKTTKKPSKPTKKNEPYSTLEDFESLCRRAMIYHQTGEYLPPDPQANICKNKYKKKAGLSTKIPDENKKKSTMFGHGRIGVSCESYGVKFCTCCNPRNHQNIPTNIIANDKYDIGNTFSQTSNLNNPKIINTPKIELTKNNLNQSNDTIIIDDFDLSPQNRFKTEIIELDDSFQDVKMNYDHLYNSTIIELSSDDSQGTIIDYNLIDESVLTQNCDDISIKTHKNVKLKNGGANLENGVVNFESGITSLNLPLETPTIDYSLIGRADLLTKKVKLQKDIDECERNIKTIFTKKLIDLSPKSVVNAQVDVKLSGRELLRKEIVDCDRNFQNIFKKKSIINLTLPNKPIPKNNLIENQIKNILTTYDKARATLQELPKNTTSPYQTNSKTIGDCPICLESLGTNDLMSTTCGHIFCAKCIKNAIKTFRACPTCRFPLTLKRIHPIFL